MKADSLHHQLVVVASDRVMQLTIPVFTRLYSFLNQHLLCEEYPLHATGSLGFLDCFYAVCIEARSLYIVQGALGVCQEGCFRVLTVT